MVRIERAKPENWERVRTLRLLALADAPDAFGRTLAQEKALEPLEWRERLSTAATFLASEGGEDVGMATAADFYDRPEAAGLFGMWVAPDRRGSPTAGRRSR